jgi:hypothetical protein
MIDDQLDVHLDNILKASGSALKHYSMQKTKDDMRQALRQAIAELESQEPVAWMDADGNVSDNNDHKCFPIPLYTHQPQRMEQEPVIMWPCHIIEADFHERTITLGMECGDYKVSAGTHWLSTHPPQRTWVGLTDEDEIDWDGGDLKSFITAVEAKLKELNT